MTVTYTCTGFQMRPADDDEENAEIKSTLVDYMLGDLELCR